MWSFRASDNQKTGDIELTEHSANEADKPHHIEGVRDVRKGEYLARSGDPARSRFYIVAGVLAVECPASRGHLAFVDTLEKDDVAGFSMHDTMRLSIRAVTPARVFACSATTVSLRRRRPTLDGKQADDDVAASAADMLAMAALRRNASPPIRVASYLLAHFNRCEPQPNGREILDLGEALPHLADLVGTTDDVLRRSLTGLACERIIGLMSERRLHLLNREKLERLALGQDASNTDRSAD